jgi:hypothetical protein
VDGSGWGPGIGGEILRRRLAESRRRGAADVQLFAARRRAGFSQRNGFTRRPEDTPGMDATSSR